MIRSLLYSPVFYITIIMYNYNNAIMNNYNNEASAKHLIWSCLRTGHAYRETDRGGRLLLPALPLAVSIIEK